MEMRRKNKKKPRIRRSLFGSLMLRLRSPINPHFVTTQDLEEYKTYRKKLDEYLKNKQEAEEYLRKHQKKDSTGKPDDETGSMLALLRNTTGKSSGDDGNSSKENSSADTDENHQGENPVKDAAYMKKLKN